MNTDGIELFSASHPKASLWRRFLGLFKRRRLSPDSLEEMEITIYEPGTMKRMLAKHYEFLYIRWIENYDEGMRLAMRVSQHYYRS